MMDSVFISSLIKIVLKYLHCAINNEVIENKAVFKPHQRNEILIFSPSNFRLDARRSCL